MTSGAAAARATRRRSRGAVLGAVVLAGMAHAAETRYHLPARDLVAARSASVTPRSADGALTVESRQGAPAVLARPVRVDARPYAYVTVAVTGLAADQQVRFGWTFEDDDTKRRAYVDLPRTGAATTTVQLPAAWRGSIHELALILTGAAATPVEIRGITLREASTAAWLAALRDDWRHFRPWSLADSNYLAAVGLGQAPGLVPLVLALALGLAAPALLLGRLVGGRRAAIAVAVVIMSGWLVLDGFWQRRLLLQLAATRDRFRSPATAAQPIDARDASLLRLAGRLREHLPADPSRRLFLLHRADRHNFERLRLHYHLLPHNVYNFGSSLPAPGTFRRGDHLLLLGAVADVAFDPEQGALVDAAGRLPAAPVHEEPGARLYRLRTPGSATP